MEHILKQSWNEETSGIRPNSPRESQVIPLKAQESLKGLDVVDVGGIVLVELQ